jgi:hypothetical protein
MVNLFPAGLAEGSAFCNRVQERKHLQHNIEHLIHTFFISPRRYGKTSLVFEVLNTHDYPYAQMQFFNAFQDAIVVKRFLQGCADLLKNLISPTQQALKKIQNLFRNVKVVLKIHGVETQFAFETTHHDPVDAIMGLLKDIESLLKSQKKTAVIFMDEFQDIVESDMSDELQACLRDFIQKSKHICFIISGSRRHMLLKLFDDSKKPFYKLFDRVLLKRIHAEDYKKFLVKHSKSHWDRALSDAVIDHILGISECHAYYFNRLCQKIWLLDKRPDQSVVDLCWSLLVEEEFSAIANEMSALTKAQRVILQTLAKKQTTKPMGKDFMHKTQVSARGIQLALDTLSQKDLIEKTTDGYVLLDPVMKKILQE